MNFAFSGTYRVALAKMFSILESTGARRVARECVRGLYNIDRGCRQYIPGAGGLVALRCEQAGSWPGPRADGDAGPPSFAGTPRRTPSKLRALRGDGGEGGTERI